MFGNVFFASNFFLKLDFMPDQANCIIGQTKSALRM